MMSLVVWIEVKLLLIRGISYRYYGFKPLNSDRPLIFIGNHQSMWDTPPIILKFYRYQPRFIAKKELRGFIPTVSFYLKYGGAVTIDRSDRKKSLEQIKKFAQQMKEEKNSACIYPEGSRSKDGKVRPFKSGGIAMLLEELPNALIVPIAISGSRKVDASGTAAKPLGVQVRVYMLEPRSLQLEQIEQGLEQIRQEIKALVEK